MASRLESSGVSGRIQVSEQVVQALNKQGQFEVECRGPIDVKGKGRLTTYLVITPYDCLETDELESLDGMVPFGSDEAQLEDPVNDEIELGYGDEDDGSGGVIEVENITIMWCTLIMIMIIIIITIMFMIMIITIIMVEV